MYEYIQGPIADITPTTVVIDITGIGYLMHISLTSYTEISTKKDVKIWVHQTVREDEHKLFGFAVKEERELFRLLISVNGIGPNTAIMMLSSYPAVEIQEAIATENVTILKSIKGIGAKTAQRVIIDLKDKITKTEVSDQIFASANNTNKNEALSALVMLGFAKKAVEKVLDKLIKEDPSQSVETLIKVALKNL